MRILRKEGGSDECCGPFSRTEGSMIVSRRNVLAATVASGALAASVARAATLGNPDSPPQGPVSIKANPKSASDPGPHDTVLDSQFPNSLMPPSTDNGDMPNFWFPFSEANRRVEDGGWACHVTTKELPIAQSLSGVDMRLTGPSDPSPQ
jgi:oxalate decarboxylase